LQAPDGHHGQVDLSQLAAVVFALVAVGVMAFQLAMALGAPWGAYAMGGAFPGRFPPALRAAAVVQAALIGGLAAIVLSTADLAWPALVDTFPWLTWLPVVVSAVATGLNAISRSAGERRIWVPVTLVMLASSLIVALSPG
jgi:cytochrome bd-type quinol oxidase subunit 2